MISPFGSTLPYNYSSTGTATGSTTYTSSVVESVPNTVVPQNIFF